MPPIDQNLNYDFNFQVMKLILILYHVKMFYFLSLTAIGDFTTTNKNNTGKYQNYKSQHQWCVSDAMVLCSIDWLGGT